MRTRADIENRSELPMLDRLVMATLAPPQRSLGLRMAQLVGFVIGAMSSLICLRFVFVLMDLNPHSPFFAWLLDVTDPPLAPFSDLFREAPPLLAGNFEAGDLVAVFIYILAGTLLKRVMRWLFDPEFDLI